MKDIALIPVSFHMKDGEYIAAVPLHYIRIGSITREKELKMIANLYRKKIKEIKKVIDYLEITKSSKKIFKAIDMWGLGDKILSLVEAVNKKHFIIDGLYDHLVRDLGRKKDWLRKAIIFRRNLPKKELIPLSLNWSLCKDAPRRSAEFISQGNFDKFKIQR